jgi:hypothetical protein
MKARSHIQRIGLVRYSPEDERFLTQRDVDMSQGTLEFNGGHAYELTRVNRALAQLARPGSREEWLSPLSRADLDGLGVFAGPRTLLRHELIERLWSRKRQLLRQATAYDGYEPEFPVA